MLIKHLPWAVLWLLTAPGSGSEEAQRAGGHSGPI